MKTILSLKNSNRTSLPAEFANDDVRYTEELVEHFLNLYTSPGQVVLDPFMGYGTTLVTAERLDRIAYGIEFDENRWRYAKSLLKFPERAKHGDSMKLDEIVLPGIDFSITSPPYMGRHHKENPFTAYSTTGSGYDQYLRDILHIYQQLAKKLNPGAHVLIEVANLKHEDGTLTLLAWNIAETVSKALKFQGETIVSWEDGYGYGYDHSYCLIFRKQD